MSEDRGIAAGTTGGAGRRGRAWWTYGAAGLIAVGGIGAAAWSIAGYTKGWTPRSASGPGVMGPGMGGGAGGGMEGGRRVPAVPGGDGPRTAIMPGGGGLADPAQRQRIVEMLGQGKTPEEITKELGLPPGSIQVQGVPGGAGAPVQLTGLRMATTEPAAPAVWERIASPLDAERVEGEIERRARDAAAKVSNLSIGPLVAGERIAKTSARLLVNAAQGADPAAEVLKAMGGEASAADAAAARLAEVLKGAEIDLANIAVHRAEKESLGGLGGVRGRGGAGTRVRQFVPLGSEGNGENGGTGGNGGQPLRTMIMATDLPLAGVFPRAEAAAKEPDTNAVEVTVPLRLSGLDGVEGTVHAAVVMVEETPGGEWRPTAVRLTAFDEALGRALLKKVRERGGTTGRTGGDR